MIKPTHLTSTVSNSTKNESARDRKKTEKPSVTSKRKMIFLAYYAIVLALVGWKVTDTLFTSAVVVGQKVELRALAQEKTSLEEELIHHQSTIATSQSLAYFEADALEGYQTISNPLTVNIHEFLASR